MKFTLSLKTRSLICSEGPVAVETKAAAPGNLEDGEHSPATQETQASMKAIHNTPTKTSKTGLTGCMRNTCGNISDG